MDKLPLDDPRWKDLDHRNWRKGKRSDWSPDAPFVADELAILEEDPSDLELFGDLWPWLSSEGTTYSAAYAAVPYFVDFAKRLPPDTRAEYLIAIGFIVANSCPEEPFCEIKDFVKTSYYEALETALHLTFQTIPSISDFNHFRYLLSAIAAIKGFQKLANVLINLDCISGECHKCGEQVFPEELQELVKDL